MNFENQGLPIAIVKTTKTKKPPVLSVDDKKSANTNYNEFHLGEEDQFQAIPDPNTERTILYISGKSGSGKSYYCKEYVKEYQKLYPKNTIYLFSSLNEDPTIDEIKGLKRIKLTPDLLEEDLKAEDFKNSLVIADDVDCLTDKKMLKCVNKILDSILQTGRHTKTSLLITSHVACNASATKMILNEAHQITMFPSTMGNRNLKYLLDAYLGLDKEQIKKVKSLKTRWVTITRSYPQIVYSQHDAFVVSAL